MASTSEDIHSLVKSEHQQLTLSEILRKPATALLGVGPEAELALSSLDVKSVFDLATSAVFTDAAKILDAGLSTKSLLYQHGAPTADLVRENLVPGVPVQQLKDQKLAALQKLPEASSEQISKALGVINIRELALWPPYRAAQKLLNTIYFPENEPGFDVDQPADLLPKNGDYPTERVQFTTLVMDEIKIGSQQALKNILADDFTPVDMEQVSAADSGFQKVAFGALITMSQSWYGQGVTLGHLLHSVSLAPGESTRIAVVDWTRKSKAGQTEVIAEEDELENQTSHNRAMNEVTQATARDAQSGFSSSNQNSSAESAGVAVSASASYFGMASIDVAANYNTSNTQAHADSYSTSSGSRDLASAMAQNVNDRTHQNAHSTRSRRAAVVKEVSMSEHNEISTRVLCNYNHMHALTIQYYEVVQVYKTKVTVAKVDKVVFIPVKLIDFNDDKTVQKYRNILAMASPVQEIRDAIRDMDEIELAPYSASIFDRLQFSSQNIALNVLKEQPSLLGIQSTLFSGVHTLRRQDPDPEDPGGAGGPRETPPAGAGTSPSPGTTPATNPAPDTTAASARLIAQKSLASNLWDLNGQAARLSDRFGRSIYRKQSESIFLPTSLVIGSVAVDGAGENVIPVFGMRDGTTLEKVEKPVRLQDVLYIGFRGPNISKTVAVTLQLTMTDESLPPVTLPTTRISKGNTSIVRVVDVKQGAVKQVVNQFLNANRMYYSTAVYRALDTTQLALLLSGYGLPVSERGLDGVVRETVQPVSQLVEPRPIRIIGNYLVFKLNTGNNDTKWVDWLKLRGLSVGYTTEDIVPLPSGGTFAEAVMGRYNCAEKLDITRFWNWQDSPIPLQPSDIAAIQAGNHDTNDNMSGPGQLGPSIISQATPTALPDPQGTAAVLTALQNGNMFRDMSGLKETIAAAVSGTQQAVAGATSAGQQASTNLANTLAANTERQRIQAQKEVAMIEGAKGVQNNSKGGLNHSQDGAKINYHDSATAKAAQGAGSAATVPSGPGAVTGGAGHVAGAVGGGGAAQPSQGNATFTPSQTRPRNPAFDAAVWGDGQSKSSLLQEAIRSASGDEDLQLQNVAYYGADTFTGDANAVAMWKDLIEYRVPDDIQSKLKTRNMSVQYVEEAFGEFLNYDLYRVKISKFPILPGTSTRATPAELFKYIRVNISDYVNHRYGDFYVWDAAQDAQWSTSSPQGAMIGIKIPLTGEALPDWLSDLTTPILSDDAAVVVAEADDVHWRFATVKTPYMFQSPSGNGTHPVSGVREWGIYKQGDVWYLYTRGIDRPTLVGESVLYTLTFYMQKQLWKSFQEKVAKMINTGSDESKGAAEVVPEFQSTVEWHPRQERMPPLNPHLPWSPSDRAI